MCDRNKANCYHAEFARVRAENEKLKRQLAEAKCQSEVYREEVMRREAATDVKLAEERKRAERFRLAAKAAGADVDFALKYLKAEDLAMRVVKREDGGIDDGKTAPWWVSFAATLREHFGIDYDVDVIEIRKTRPRSKWAQAERELKAERARRGDAPLDLFGKEGA